MKFLKVVLIALYTSLVLTSCRFDEEDAAKTQLLGMLNDRVNKGGLFAEKDYGAQYWENLPREKWLQSQSFINSTHGSLRDYKVMDIQSKGKKKGFSSAGWVGFIVATTYEKGVEGQEQINFYKRGKEQPFEIISHSVNSPIIENLRRKSQ